MTSSKQPFVIFGELLYDCFSDGRKVPGGAPFNVAWNLQALGSGPFFISAVGQDPLGLELKQFALDWGLAVHGIQHTPEHATSVVEVSLKDGIPSYAIIENTAMDHLKVPAILNYSSEGILYHGSLAVRSSTSMESLRSIRKNWKGRVFIDINIRSPWFDAERFLPLLQGTDFLKINDEEFAQLMGETLEASRLEEQLKRLTQRFGVGQVILTCGKKGAFWYVGAGQLYDVPATGAEQVVDTVGAGDAFASVCLLGIHRDWSPPLTLQRASAFAGKVCTIQGATSQDSSFYQLS